MSTRPEIGSPDELAWLRGYEEARNHFLAENELLNKDLVRMMKEHSDKTLSNMQYVKHLQKEIEKYEKENVALLEELSPFTEIDLNDSLNIYVINVIKEFLKDKPELKLMLNNLKKEVGSLDYNRFITKAGRAALEGK